MSFGTEIYPKVNCIAKNLRWRINVQKISYNLSFEFEFPFCVNLLLTFDTHAYIKKMTRSYFLIYYVLMCCINLLYMSFYNSITVSIFYNYLAKILCFSNMYIHVEEVSEALHRYLVERCKRSFAFALQVCEIN